MLLYMISHQHNRTIRLENALGWNVVGQTQVADLIVVWQCAGNMPALGLDLPLKKKQRISISNAKITKYDDDDWFYRSKTRIRMISSGPRGPSRITVFCVLQVKQKPESQFAAALVKFAHTYSPPQSNKLSTQVGITGPNWPGTHCRHNSYSPRSASIYTFG